MSFLQKQLDEFIDNWEEGMINALTFENLDPDTKLGEFHEIEKSDNVSYVEIDALNYSATVVLSALRLENNYYQKMGLWAQEKQLQNEEYYRSVI